MIIIHILKLASSRGYYTDRGFDQRVMKLLIQPFKNFSGHYVRKIKTLEVTPLNNKRHLLV